MRRDYDNSGRQMIGSAGDNLHGSLNIQHLAPEKYSFSLLFSDRQYERSDDNFCNLPLNEELITHSP
jgi:hypothetical protein